MLVCNRCGENKPKKGKKYCSPCHRKPWRAHRKGECEECGFVPVWLGQLDVDHIDGDKTNNDPSNYQTLCANCHRLKTHLNGDYK